MAGKPGRSGGARVGAGRPRKDVTPEAPVQHVEAAAGAAIPAPAKTPLDFMVGIMNDTRLDARLRLQAAISAAPFMHERKGSGGVRDERQSKAEDAANAYRPAAPPRLVSNG